MFGYLEKNWRDEMAPIIVAEIEKYLSEKKDFIIPLIKHGTHNLIVANTGSGKTTFALELAKENKYTILLSPLRIIVDQMLAEAQRQNLEIIGKEKIDEWETFEIQQGDSRIYIGTFSSVRKHPPNWAVADYVFLDEVHFLLDLSVFGEQTALPIWNLIHSMDKYPNLKLISLTASDELILPLQRLFNFSKIFLAKSDQWRLKPNKIRVYPTIQGMNNTDYILHYCKHFVKDGEKILCIVKSYSELNRLKELIQYLPNDVEIANAQEKSNTATYWEICLKSQFPKTIRMFIATTWISLGASILDETVKHVICTFPNYSIVYQSLSRIRNGGVQIAVMQLKDSPMEGDFLPKSSDFEKELANREKFLTTASDLYALYNGKRVYFPLPAVSKMYQIQQEYIFSDLGILQSHLEDNLDCNVEILWTPLFQFLDKTINKQQLKLIENYAVALNFPFTKGKGLLNALRLNLT